ncbi:MAG: nucleotide pyrophosphohydrolase [Clostridia bacterium]|nr:nucleotide pyrophosphohydrolase [Clostridia bacterium]
MDPNTTLQDLKDAVRDMCLYRGWGGERAIQNPQRMAMAMAIELGELMEHFAWLDAEELRDLVDGKLPRRREHIAEELADILIYAIQLARGLDVDISDAVLRKIEIVKGRREDPDLGRSHPHVDSDR